MIGALVRRPAPFPLLGLVDHAGRVRYDCGRHGTKEKRHGYTYTVILRQEPEGGYTVLVPSLRGCVTWGRNIVESLQMAREAIECYLESVLKHGEPVPEEGPVGTVPDWL